MTYAVIDTNVFVSALLSRFSDAATVQVVEAISKNGICPLYNEEIYAEYEEVLNRDKFNFPSDLIRAILDKVKKFGVSTNRVPIAEYFPDPKDVVFYEVAMSKEEAYLVTGNKKHFPSTPIVVTPVEMVEILKETLLL